MKVNVRHKNSPVCLDRDAVVISNIGHNANPRHIMDGGLDSVTLKEHNIDTFINYYEGICPDSDPYWENDLKCIFHSDEDWNRKWFNNLEISGKKII